MERQPNYVPRCTLTGSRVHIPPESRPFTRVVAAAFDAYLEPNPGRHSAAV